MNPIIDHFIRHEGRALVAQYRATRNDETRHALLSAFREHFLKLKWFTYFRKVLHYEAKHYDRKQRQERQRFPLILDDRGDVETASPTQNEPLSFALAQLTERQRFIITLAYIGQWRDVEIARCCAISPQAVSRQRQRALLKLRKVMTNG